MFRLPQNDGTSRRRFSPIALISGVAATVILALTTTGTLATFTAQITNTAATASTGLLTMSEVVSGITCNSSDGLTAIPAAGTNNQCSTINDYGATLLTPGGSSKSTTVTITNTGTVAAGTFTLTPGTCVAGTALTGTSGNAALADLCSKVTVSITAGTTALVTNGTASNIAGTALSVGTLAAGASMNFTITTGLSGSADSSYQNRTISQPLLWAFAV